MKKGRKSAAGASGDAEATKGRTSPAAGAPPPSWEQAAAEGAPVRELTVVKEEEPPINPEEEPARMLDSSPPADESAPAREPAPPPPVPEAPPAQEQKRSNSGRRGAKEPEEVSQQAAEKIAARAQEAAGTAPPPVMDGEEIALDRIVESPLNPRTNFANIEKLAASIRRDAVGLLVPVLVRPNSALGQGVYELGFGARRYRAVKLNAEKHGGPRTIRVIVRPLTDRDLVELALIENLEREDLSDLEQGAGFYYLKEKQGVPVKELSEKFGVGERTIYNRIQMYLSLCPEVRAAVEAKEIIPSIALEISRRPNKDGTQIKMLQEVKARGINTHAAAEALFREMFAYELSSAPFDKDDPFLVADAGACGVCPHNSTRQNQLELGDGRPPPKGQCTFIQCFKEKVAANVAKELEKHAAKGVKKLSAADSKRLFQGGTTILPGAEYVGLESPAQEHPKRPPWSKLLGAETPQLYAAVDPSGNVHLVVDRTEAVNVARKLKTLDKEQAERAGRDPAKERRAVQQASDMEEAVAQKILVAGIAAAEEDLDSKLLRAMVSALLADASATVRGPMEQRRGHSLEQLRKDLPRLKLPILRGLLFELVLGEQAECIGAELADVMDALKLDRKKLEREVKEERQKELDLKAAEKTDPKAKKKKPKAA